MRPSHENKRPAPKAGDYVAGAGGGGVLVYCVQHFIKDPYFSQAALYVCPAISMFVVGLYQRLSAFTLAKWDYFVGESERKALLKRSDENIADCRKKLESVEADPNATSNHRTELRTQLENLEKAHFQLRLKGSVVIIPGETRRKSDK